MDSDGTSSSSQTKKSDLCDGSPTTKNDYINDSPKHNTVTRSSITTRAPPSSTNTVPCSDNPTTTWGPRRSKVQRHHRRNLFLEQHQGAVRQARWELEQFLQAQALTVHNVEHAVLEVKRKHGSGEGGSGARLDTLGNPSYTVARRSGNRKPLQRPTYATKLNATAAADWQLMVQTCRTGTPFGEVEIESGHYSFECLSNKTHVSCAMILETDSTCTIGEKGLRQPQPLVLAAYLIFPRTMDTGTVPAASVGNVHIAKLSSTPENMQLGLTLCEVPGPWLQKLSANLNFDSSLSYPTLRAGGRTAKKGDWAFIKYREQQGGRCQTRQDPANYSFDRSQGRLVHVLGVEIDGRLSIHWYDYSGTSSAWVSDKEYINTEHPGAIELTGLTVDVSSHAKPQLVTLLTTPEDVCNLFQKEVPQQKQTNKRPRTDTTGGGTKAKKAGGNTTTKRNP